MGKVTIAEPSAGESLTVTDVNTTLGNFNTQASSIDGDNIHDQSLDGRNFEENCSTEIPYQPYRVDARDFIPQWQQSTSLPGFVKTGIWSVQALTLGGSQNLDFSTNDYIARVHFGLVIRLPNTFSVGNFHSNVFLKIQLGWTAANGQSGMLNRTKREVRFSSDLDDFQQTGKFYLKSVGITTHLSGDNFLQSAATLSNFKLVLHVQPNQDALGVVGLGGQVEYVQIHGINMLIETYKR
tara:strand:+ start:8438 stop:9154 length:717 start_codon:yes stop_codon:yes gene_type:complete